MSTLPERIKNAKSMKDLDALRMDCVLDRENFLSNQRLFIKQKNKIRRHGGQLND
ncbi:hypothetical protein [Sporosarcina sp. FSL K6-2383]|uniref:hypothetical protein n=1 Tax=Sporosarcina sp. FSL K6-2383 TaxID=2921556 RepID=UPI00315A72CF